MAVQILYFGKLRETAGRASEQAELPPEVDTAGELIAWIGARDAALGEALSRPSVRVAVDKEIAPGPGARVAGASEIAFMPPMSGG